MTGTHGLIGTSAAMRELRDEIERVAPSGAKVLITGESGVGKELVATAVHTLSQRASRPFIAVNCAGIPETLLESELFGHTRGSFTGAYRDRPGQLELADRGSIFLDEIGEMSLRMQGLLLRFLETGDLQKVGLRSASSQVDVRVIAATNRDLRHMIAQGQFREDLFYRLNVIHIVVPPLSERKEDIPALSDYLLERLCRKNDRPVLRLSPEARLALAAHTWPGNVRELENQIERIVVRATGDEVVLDDLPTELQAPRRTGSSPRRERRRTVADELYERLVDEQQSFWTTVYPLYMRREITRSHVRDLVRKGLEEARGNYKIVARMFNMESDDYKRFLNFLRKHDCQLPFREYR
jgi:transcriptional regulator with GAF, ATPase, and Fis domain